jgi:hypothetical protein
MNLSSLWHRFRGILPEILLIVLLMGLWLLSRHYAPFRQKNDIAQIDPHRNMPRETRYQGLDYFSATGLRLPAYKGVKTIEIGSVLLRRKKTGFIRIGAFNEALISDVRIVLDAEAFGFKATVSAVATNIGVGPVSEPSNREKQVLLTMEGSPQCRSATEETNTINAPQNEISETLQQVFKDVITGLFSKNQKISGAAFRNVGIDVIDAAGFSWSLLHADGAMLVATPSRRELRFQGNIVIRNTEGDILTCEKANLVAGRAPTIVASHGNIQTQIGIRPFKELTFAVQEIFQGNGHLWVDSPPLAVKMGGGLHTPPSRIRIP